jgi:predicted phosphoribosyltransferase
MPAELRAIGLHYLDFSQVSDDEVIALLDASVTPTTETEPAADARG